MRFRYGSYTHRENEAHLMAFFVRPTMNRRGRRISSKYEMHVQIELVLPSSVDSTDKDACQAWFTSEIQTLVRVYGENGKDAYFLQDDGTPTSHSLMSGPSISGVTVHQRSWPRGDGAEYATTRTGYIVLRAEYVELDSPLWSYQELVTNVGSGGPRWELHSRVVGDPVDFILSQRTPQYVTQVGRAVGVLGYPLAYMIPLYAPKFEHTDRRIVAPGSPEFFGNGYMLYPLNWAFHFEFKRPTNSFPNII